MGRRRRAPEEPVPGPIAFPAIIGDDAISDLLELLDYIAAESPANARKVSQRITAEVDRIAGKPQLRKIDDDAPDVPDGVTAHKVTVSGFTIRYVHPVELAGRPRVLIVSIQRGVRMLDKPEYLLRLLEERARPNE